MITKIVALATGLEPPQKECNAESHTRRMETNGQSRSVELMSQCDVRRSDFMLYTDLQINWIQAARAKKETESITINGLRPYLSANHPNGIAKSRAIKRPDMISKSTPQGSLHVPGTQSKNSCHPFKDATCCWTQGFLQDSSGIFPSGPTTLVSFAKKMRQYMLSTTRS
jgi:hypothetical protein